MEESNSRGTPFEIPLQTPQAPQQHAPVQSLRWADFDDSDTDWIPDDIKARIAVRANATTNATSFEGNVPQSEPSPSSSGKKSHLDYNENKAPVQPESSAGIFSTSVLSLKTIQPWLESD